MEWFCFGSVWKTRFGSDFCNNWVVNLTAGYVEWNIYVLAAILSDIFDGSDTYFIYILLVSESQQRNSEEHFETNKQQMKL